MVRYNNFSRDFDFRLLPFSGPPLKCYQCKGTGQDCRNEELSKNSSSQVVCEDNEDRCFWAYHRFNSSLEVFGLGCRAAQFCEKLSQICHELMSSNENECCDGSCCHSDLCNKLKYTGM